MSQWRPLTPWSYFEPPEASPVPPDGEAPPILPLTVNMDLSEFGSVDLAKGAIGPARQCSFPPWQGPDVPGKKAPPDLLEQLLADLDKPTPSKALRCQDGRWRWKLEGVDYTFVQNYRCPGQVGEGPTAACSRWLSPADYAVYEDSLQLRDRWLEGLIGPLNSFVLDYRSESPEAYTTSMLLGQLQYLIGYAEQFFGYQWREVDADGTVLSTIFPAWTNFGNPHPLLPDSYSAADSFSEVTAAQRDDPFFRVYFWMVVLEYRLGEVQKQLTDIANVINNKPVGPPFKAWWTTYNDLGRTGRDLLLDLALPPFVDLSEDKLGAPSAALDSYGVSIEGLVTVEESGADLEQDVSVLEVLLAAFQLLGVAYDAAAFDDSPAPVPAGWRPGEPWLYVGVVHETLLNVHAHWMDLGYGFDDARSLVFGKYYPPGGWFSGAPWSAGPAIKLLNEAYLPPTQNGPFPLFPHATNEATFGFQRMTLQSTAAQAQTGYDHFFRYAPQVRYYRLINGGWDSANKPYVFAKEDAYCSAFTEVGAAPPVDLWPKD